MARETVNTQAAAFRTFDERTAAFPPWPIAQDGNTLLVAGAQDVNRRLVSGGAWTRVTLPGGNSWGADWDEVQPHTFSHRNRGGLRWAYHDFKATNKDTKIWTVGAGSSTVSTEDWNHRFAGPYADADQLARIGADLWALTQGTGLGGSFVTPTVYRENSTSIATNLGVGQGSSPSVYAMLAPPLIVGSYPTGNLFLYQITEGTVRPLAKIANDVSWPTSSPGNVSNNTVLRFHGIGDGTTPASVWLSWLTSGNKIKLYRRSNVTTYTGNLPTGTTSSDWDQVLIARMSGGVGICLIDRTVSGGRPNIQACFWKESDATFGNWVRLETKTDWGTDTMSTRVGWLTHPSDSAVRLSAVRYSTSAGTLYLYEETVGNQPPYSPVITAPLPGDTAATSRPLRLAWRFSDPDAGDTQSAFEVRRTIGSTVRYRTSTGWQATSDAQSKMSSSAAALTLPSGWGAQADGDHHYAVRTWDQANTAGPWSTNLRVIPSTPPPKPRITAPAAGATIQTTPITLRWTSSNQDAYRIRTGTGRSGTINTVISDTGTIMSSAKSATVELGTETSSLIIELRTLNATGLESPVATITIRINLTPPRTVTPSPVGSDGLGLILVGLNWAGSGKAPDSADLYRRESDPVPEYATTFGEVRVARDLPFGTPSFEDYLVASGVDYEYRTVSKLGSLTARSDWADSPSGSEYRRVAVEGPMVFRLIAVEVR